LTVDAYGNEEA